MANIYDKILKDGKVKLTEMFDRNFSRQGFFGKKWVATRATKINKAGKQGSILIVTGQMRRSIQSYIRGNGIVFTSNLPYTALHNEGGTYAVSVRAHQRTSRKGNTYTVRSHTRNMRMPQRQFIGEHARVQQQLADIIAKNLQQFSEQLAKNFNRK
ncbi:MAG: phage virion morphogenesis protein [Paludibacteraceae bacterium]